MTTAKHLKILSVAATKTGFPLGVYMTEADELRAAGLIELRETFSAVGARNTRWFLTAKED